MPLLRVGVDCGGTNTDAVCLSPDNRVLGWAKQPTSKDLLQGIVAAVQAALLDAHQEAAQVQAVMLGTTQFVNACIQLRGLARVAVVRLCGPATRSLPPFCDMPPALRDAVGGCYFLAAGGYEYDGPSEISPLDESQLRGIARKILAAGIRCVVVSGVFSPVQAAQERRATAVMREEAAAVARGGDSAGSGLGGAAATSQQPEPFDIFQSHEIGRLGLLERENAAILNAALQPLARRVVPACQAALAVAGISAPLFFTGNDGTLLSAGEALKMPVATFQSGPVNSLRGAALLTGLQHAAVLDIGGTTTDAGLLQGGMPRPAGSVVRFAGAPTNLSMPDVLSVGLGGGSLVRWGPEGCAIGPNSVGADLPTAALCMGGGTCTASDVAVLLGRMQLGRREAVAPHLPQEAAQVAWAQIQRQLEAVLDSIKTEAVALPVVVVGGGAPLCGEHLAGASSVVRPQHASVANAIGAAITQVSGVVDAVHDMGSTAAARQAVLAAARQLATERAVAAGAAPGSCRVASQSEVPLAYLPGSTARVTVKVVGELDLDRLDELSTLLPHPSASAAEPPAGQADAGAQQPADQAAIQATAAPEAAGLQCSSATADATPAIEAWPPLPGREEEPSPAALAGWQPQLDAKGQWILHPEDLHLVALGTGILGCGGGGSPGRALLKAVMQLQSSGVGSMRVIAPAAVPDDQLVVDAGFMGAPTVGIEKLDADQAEVAVHTVLAAYRAGDAAWCTSGSSAGTPGSGVGAACAALLAGEIGGGNGLEPLAVAARMGLPVVDGDLMGRAFPELQMMTSAIYGQPVVPAAVADEKGNRVVVQRAASAAWLERLLRPLCTEMGCSAGFSSRPLTGSELRRVLVPHSLSLAWRLGSALAHARHAKRDCPAAAAAAGGGSVLFTGKVVGVQRETREGFARGRLLLEGSGACAGRTVQIDFQNENLLAVEGLASAAAPLPGSAEAGAPMQVQRAAAERPSPASLPTTRVASSEGHTEVPTSRPASSAERGDAGLGVGGEPLLLACVPHLICCVEAESGLPVSTEEQRYGLRVAVLGLPAHPLLWSEEALRVVGPAAFGYPGIQPPALGMYSEPIPIPSAGSG